MATNKKTVKKTAKKPAKKPTTVTEKAVKPVSAPTKVKRASVPVNPVQAKPNPVTTQQAKQKRIEVVCAICNTVVVGKRAEHGCEPYKFILRRKTDGVIVGVIT